jgi:hypothetical protein
MGELQGQEQGIHRSVDDRRRCVFLGKFFLRMPEDAWFYMIER